ncbi:hypothetical protein [uncultured Succinivibrio sp.]|uniref:hypothetical protein n=1 Tax=uncultured Succinivibrio sp. TaxID=540749 RepID=UPI0025E71848|nr:hypothetical protein [uncultured Succinivibrio sp.]
MPALKFLQKPELAPIPVQTPRRCTFYNIAYSGCRIFEHLKKDGKKVLRLTFLKSARPCCSICGMLLIKDGFTDYEKVIYNYGKNCVEKFQLQRLTCANRQCHGSKEIHVLLREDMIPQEAVDSVTADEVLKAHKIFYRILELSPQPRKKLTQKHIEELCRGEPYLSYFFKKYHGDSFLFARYILGRHAKRLHSAVNLLRNITPNLLRTQHIVAGNISGQDYLSTDFKEFSSKDLSLSNILLTICRRGLISSTLHKISLPYSASNIVLRKDIVPP